MSEENREEVGEYDYGAEPEWSDEEQTYRDKVSLPDLATVAKVSHAFNHDGTTRTHIKATKADFIASMLYLDGHPFSFEGRGYLRPIYNQNDPLLLLKTGRQVEKCVCLRELVLYYDGSRRCARDVAAGDEIASLDIYESRLVAGTVTWVSPVRRRPCLRITTERGFVLEAAVTHPVRVRGLWIDAGALRAGLQVATTPGRGFDPPGRDLGPPELDGDVCWDPVVSVEDIGGQDCVDFTVGEHHNFVAGGVVTHNSTLLVNNLVITSAVKPYAKSLYVSPSHTQTRQFSNEKLRSAIERSPLIRRYLQDTSVSAQVFEKGFTNGSYIFLRSAFRTADRARGISASEILALDEFQDFLGSEIPVIMECTSHYPGSRTLMTGTPKSFDNPIELHWQESTQNEWLVPCSCGKWNYLDADCIGPTELYKDDTLPPGPVCKRCKKPIDVRAGEWVSFAKGAPVQGYRIAQLMVPWIVGGKGQWERFLLKRDTYPAGQFANEALGLSYDSSSRPVTRDDLLECCRDYDLWDVDHISVETVTAARDCVLIGGIDWGEGNDGSERGPTGKLRNASYSVLTIGSYVTEHRFEVKAIKKYMGRETDPDFVTRDIARICETLGVILVGADYGHGWGPNNTLVRLLGPSRVMMFQYLPKLKEKMKWDPHGKRYHLHRNFIMSEVFFDIKNKFISFPRWSQFERFGKEILAIFAEYSEYRREIKYDHRPSDPDDFFHALVFCKMAADIYYRKSRRYTMQIDHSVESHQ